MPLSPSEPKSERQRDITSIILRPMSRTAVHRFRRGTLASTMVSSTSTENSYNFSVQLDSLVNYTELTALYDFYRFRQVTMYLFPSYTVAPSNSGASNLQGFLAVCPDYDDAASTSIAELQQRPETTFHPLGIPLKITYRPRALQMMSDSAGLHTGTGVAPADIWIDMSSTTFKFYGVKTCFPVTAMAVSYTTFLVVDLECKMVR